MSKPWLDALQKRLADSTTRGTGSVTADGSGNVTLDEGTYENFRLVLTATAMTILAPTNSVAGVAAGDTFSLYLDMDATGNRAIPPFAGGVGGFASDTQAQIQAVAVGTASTRTRCSFKFDGSIWFLDHIPYSGGATS
jgi:hypothetical protein